MASTARDCMMECENMARDIQDFLKTNPSQEQMRSKLIEIKDSLWVEHNDLRDYLGYND